MVDAEKKCVVVTHLRELADKIESGEVEPVDVNIQFHSEDAGWEPGAMARTYAGIMTLTVETRAAGK